MPVINLSLNRSQSVAQIRPKITNENRRQRSVTISEEKTKFYSDNTVGTLCNLCPSFISARSVHVPKQKFCKQKRQK